MTIDKYSMCPGGTGKKIKFCCADLTSELDKLDRMQAAEQYQACLEYVQRLEAKYPNRQCLARIKIDVLRALERTDEAREVVEQVLQQDNDNPTALAEAVLLTLDETPNREGVLKAIDMLQTAIEAAGDWPEVMLQAVLGVGAAALDVGLWAAGQGHLVVYQAATRDPEVSRYMVRLNSMGMIPWALRDVQKLRSSLGDDIPWKAEFEAAMALAGRVRWRTAAQKLTELSQSADHPAIWNNLGVIRAWLGDHEGAIEAWQRYLAHDISFDEQVVAHAVIGTLAQKAAVPKVDMLQIRYPIANWDQLIERLISHPQIRAASMLRYGDTVVDEDTQPSRVLEIADRPGDAPQDHTQLDAYPRLCGELLLVPRTTSREPQAVLVCPADWESTARSLVEDAAGDALGAPQAAEPAGRSTGPKDIAWEVTGHAMPPMDQAADLARKATSQALRDRWIHHPNAWLDDRTPAQAAEDPSQRSRLEALVAVLENDLLQNDVDPWPNLLANEVRQALGLPTQFEYTEGMLDDSVRLYQLTRINPASIPAEELWPLFELSQFYGIHRAMLNLGQELLARPDVLKPEDRPQLMILLGSMLRTLPKGLEYFEQAREALVAINQSPAQAIGLELVTLSQQGNIPRLIELAESMRRRFGNDPEVMAVLREVFAMLQSGFAAQGAARPQAESEAPAGGSKLWTPDSEPTQPSQSKIWTPD